MKDKKCLMVPNVAGRSVQWIDEAEGGASADWCSKRSTGGASADWCSKRCFLSFFYYLLDGSGLDRDCIVFARK